MTNHFIGQKRCTFLLGVFVILMMIMIIFSQMAMEIYAYSFIATKNINDIETVDKILEMKKQNGETSDNSKKKSKSKKPKKTVSEKASAVSFIMPVKNGITTSVFGETVSRNSAHLGHDWAVETGTKVRASADGIVERAYYSESYGYNVLLRHENGFETRYAHLSKLKVKAGEIVKQNQVIGLSGSTGDSTGPHLHFEVIQDGTRINPMKKVEICH